MLLLAHYLPPPHPPTPQSLSPWGLLTGALWTLAIITRVASIGILGLCSASAVAEVTTGLTAFAYSVSWKGEAVKCWALAALGLTLIAMAWGQMWVLEAQEWSRRGLVRRLWKHPLDDGADGDDPEVSTAAAASGAGAGSSTSWQTGPHPVAAEGAPVAATGFNGSSPGDDVRVLLAAPLLAVPGRVIDLLLSAKERSLSEYVTGTAYALISGACVGKDVRLNGCGRVQGLSGDWR